MDKYDAFNNGGDEYGLTFLLGVVLIMVGISAVYFAAKMIIG